MDFNGIRLPVPSKIHSAETQIREQAFSKIVERIKGNSNGSATPEILMPVGIAKPFPTTDVNPFQKPY